MSNLGYLRGIDGRLTQHFRYFHRHVYCPVNTQKRVIAQLAQLLEREQPDLCCFLEIDKGSSDSADFNQLEAMVGGTYPYFDIENKYGPDSRLKKFSRGRGKSNGFMARHDLPHEKIYFTHGTKRLIYKVMLPSFTLFFTHFSLTQTVRHQQFLELRRLLAQASGDILLLGDFNIWNGFSELAPLLLENDLHLVSREDEPTFTFHRFRKTLDLCICSKPLAPRLSLRVIPQPFSDHDALLVELKGD